MISTPLTVALTNHSSSSHSNKPQRFNKKLIRPTYVMIGCYAALCGRTAVAYSSAGIMGGLTKAKCQRKTEPQSIYSQTRLNSKQEHHSRNRIKMYCNSNNGQIGRLCFLPMKGTRHHPQSNNQQSRHSRHGRQRQQHTLLHYLNHNNESIEERDDGTNPIWWRRINNNKKKPSSGSKTGTGKSKLPEEQYILDDYLEFLDKRYHRLHDDDSHNVGKKRTTRIDTAWNWLFDCSDLSSSSSTINASSRNEDALYALGVADLASERLLQKHNLNKSASSVVIDAPRIVVLPNDKIRQLKDLIRMRCERWQKKAVSHIDQLLRPISASRDCFVTLQRQVPVILATFVANIIARLSTMLSKMTKDTLKRAGTVTSLVTAISVLLLVKPLKALASTNA